MAQFGLDDGTASGTTGPTQNLTRLSRGGAELANLGPDDAAPYVGANAFTHKAGVHAGAVRKYAEACERVKPGAVGRTCGILVSELAGRANLRHHFEGLYGEQAQSLMAQVKELEAQGYQFEDAECSMHLIVARSVDRVPRYYVVDRFHVSVTHDQ